MNDVLPVGDDDLHAYVDNQLAPERRAVVAAYLDAHPQIAARVADYEEERAALIAALQPSHDEPVPARLRVANIVAARRFRRTAILTRAAAAVLLLAAGGASGWYGRSLVDNGSGHDVQMLTADAVTAFRTFTVEVAHPVEVRADARAHLVQWLSNRLKQPIVVPELAAEGFKLMGGRLLPAEYGPAGLLMYEDSQGTRLTIYLHPSALDLTELRYTEIAGVQTFYRAENGLAFAVTARTDRDRLLAVTRAVEGQVLKPKPAQQPI